MFQAKKISDFEADLDRKQCRLWSFTFGNFQETAEHERRKLQLHFAPKIIKIHEVTKKLEVF